MHVMRCFINLFIIPVIPLYIYYRSIQDSPKLSLRLVTNYLISVISCAALTRIVAVIIQRCLGIYTDADTSYYTIIGCVVGILLPLIYRETRKIKANESIYSEINNSTVDIIQTANIKSKFWDKLAKSTFICSMCFMIFAHGFCFTNLMYSHDSLSYFELTGIAKIGLGRWLYPYLVKYRMAATPFFIGIVSSVYVSIAVVLIVKLLELNRFESYVACAIFATNITLTSLFCTYIFDADADCLAVLLACFAVYAKEKFPRWLNYVIPAVCIIACMGLYQTYISLSAGLFVLVLIKKSNAIENIRGFQKALMDAAVDVAILLVGVLGYIVVMRIAAAKCGVQLSNGYNGPAAIEGITVKQVISNIPNTYKFVRDTFFNANGYNLNYIVLINKLLLAISLIELIILFWQNRKCLYKMIITIIGLFLFPLAINTFYLISFGTMHNLMIYAFNLVYMIPIVFFNQIYAGMLLDGKDSSNINIAKKILSATLCASIILITLNNIIYSNGAYTYKKLVYDNTLLNAQTVWEDVNSIVGYEEGTTPVVLMGSFTSSKAAYHSSLETRYLGVLTGADSSSITYNGTANCFYYGLLGKGMNIIYDDGTIAQTKEYTDMPVYPAPGYCKNIDGKVVVKMSN